MESATKNGTFRQFEVFTYPCGPDEPGLPMWEGWDAPGDVVAEEPESAARNRDREEAEAAMRSEFERRMVEETRKAFEAGREKGRQEGRLAEHETQAAALNAAAQLRIRQASELVESFSRERDRFLRAVEREVVELALSVAARILRREAQMDPLLLTGAVRVALGQLSGSTQVRLRVPAGELELWTEAMALLPNLPVRPTVLAGDGMRLGDCLIETELGSVDLGIRSQLGEIERGFFDRVGSPRGGAVTDPGDTGGKEVRS